MQALPDGYDRAVASERVYLQQDRQDQSSRALAEILPILSEMRSWCWAEPSSYVSRNVKPCRNALYSSQSS
jgi:hypothetical protein